MTYKLPRKLGVIITSLFTKRVTSFNEDKSTRIISEINTL